MVKPYSGPPPILVGYDGSDDAGRALEYAARLAAATKTMLHLVYVADDTIMNSAWSVVFDASDLNAHARKVLAEAVLIAHSFGAAKKRMRTKVVIGSPVSVLTVLSQSSSLLVVGRRSSSGSDRRFGGSTAVGLAATSRCPVIVASDDPRPEPGAPIGVALDPGGGGRSALDWVLETRLAAAATPIKVLTVCKAPQGRLFRSVISEAPVERAMAETVAQQAAALADVRRRHPEAPEIQAEVRYGSVVDELVSFAESLQLLVLEVGVHFPTYTIGGVARGVLAHATCPVAFVR